jgi:hypothetical protein
MFGKLKPPSESGRIGAASPVSAAAGAIATARLATSMHSSAAHAASPFRLFFDAVVFIAPSREAMN